MKVCIVIGLLAKCCLLSLFVTISLSFIHYYKYMYLLCSLNAHLISTQLKSSRQDNKSMTRTVGTGNYFDILKLPHPLPESVAATATAPIHVAAIATACCTTCHSFVQIICHILLLFHVFCIFCFLLTSKLFANIFIFIFAGHCCCCLCAIQLKQR